MFCPHCGNQISDDASFCSKCGKGIPNTTGKESFTEIKRQPSRNIGKTIPKSLIIGVAVAAAVILCIILFCRIPGRRSAPEIALGNKPEIAESNKPVVGGTYYFGRYPQSADGDKKDILWDVIAEDNGSYMLLSHYVLFSYPYNLSWDHVIMDWYESDVYKMLNSDFANEAFDREELGKLTSDVSLLSLDEVYAIFPGENINGSYLSGKLACSPTDYAKQWGVQTNSIDELTNPNSSFNTKLFESVKNDIDEDTRANIATDWMLRDTGIMEGRENMVYSVQYVYTGCYTEMTDNNGIRPVIWISGD